MFLVYVLLFWFYNFRDHAGGNAKMKNAIPDIRVVGGDERIEAITHPVKDGDTLQV